MTARAVVYLPEVASHGLAAVTVAGRALLFRTVMACVRAGCVEVGLPGRLRELAVAAELTRDPRVGSALVWLEESDEQQRERFSRAGVLLVPAGVLVPEPGLVRLRDAGAGPEGGMPPEQVVVLAASRATPWPALRCGGEVLRPLWPRLAAGAPLGSELGELARAASTREVDGTARPWPSWSVVDPAGRRRAARSLLEGLRFPADSLLDRAVHRRLSRHVTVCLLDYPVTPNQVTLLSLLLGLGAAWLLARGRPGAAVLGLLLYGLAVVLDHADGELARLTFRESAFGARLDVVADTVTHVALVLAIAWAAYPVVGSTVWLTGPAAACGVAASALVVRGRPPGAAGQGPGDAMLQALSGRDALYAVLGLFAASLWLHPPALGLLLWLLALGSQAFWVTWLLRARSG